MQTPPFIAQYIDPLLQSSGLWFIARLSLAVCSLLRAPPR